MINRLADASRIANSSQSLRNPKGLSLRLVRRSSKSEGGSCAAAKADWSPERRARQAARIRLWQPWRRSTGPRTSAGKARSAANALKHGFRSRTHIETMQQVRTILRVSALNLAIARAWLRTRAAHGLAARHPQHPFGPQYNSCHLPAASLAGGIDKRPLISV